MVARSEAGSRTWRALSRRPPRTSFSFRSLRQLIVASLHVWCFYDFESMRILDFPSRNSDAKASKPRIRSRVALGLMHRESLSVQSDTIYGSHVTLYTLHSTLLSSTASTALYGSTVGTFCLLKILRRLYGYTRLHDKTTLQISTVGFLCFRRFCDSSAELHISTGVAEFSSRV